MKVHDVPQDDVEEYYAGIKRACYAVDDEGKYVVVTSRGWIEEEAANRLAVEELAESLERTRIAVLDGRKSPLAYHMERRQMTPDILGKTAGIAAFRVRRHLRPHVFARLKPSLLERYAKALAVSVEDLKTVPRRSPLSVLQ